MNHSPFWPLVWKEYRAGRAFWLAMAVMGLVAQGAVAWLAHVDRHWWLFQIALMSAAGFAVGIGGTLFAMENEERTIALLRMLPVRATQLGAAKIVSALAGLVGLLAVLWLAANMMCDWLPLPAWQARRLWSVWGLACLEALAWGILWSLVVRRPLVATLLAAGTVALVDLSGGVAVSGGGIATVSFGETVPYRTALLALVMLVDTMLLPGWLSDRRQRQMPVRRLIGWAVRSAASACRRPLPQLTWQTFREGWISFLLLVLATPIVFVLVDMARVRIGLQNRNPAGGMSQALALRDLLPLGLIAALSGVLVFHADQVHGPRFLGARGVSPSAVWLSRQLMWGWWLWLWSLAAIAGLSYLAYRVLVHQLFGPVSPTPPTAEERNLIRWVLYVNSQYWTKPVMLEMLLPAFAAGQVASLAVRRGLLAGVLGLMLGTLALLWAWLMHTIGDGWWWSVLPLVVGMFAATYLRMPDWLMERSSLRSWLAPAAAVLVPLAAIALAVPAYRVLEIPLVRPKFPEPVISPAAEAEARGTLELYRKASDLYLATREATIEYDQSGGHYPTPLSPADEVWARPVVDLVLEASRRKASLLSLSIADRRSLAHPLRDLEKLLLAFAVQQQKVDRLDEALDLLLASFQVQTQLSQCMGSNAPAYMTSFRALRDWSAAHGQTAVRLQSAIERLKRCHAAFPSPQDWLLPAYEETELTINNLETGVRSDIVRADQVTNVDWLLTRMPWERARAQRILDCRTDWLIAELLQAKRSLNEDRPVTLGAQPRIGSLPCRNVALHTLGAERAATQQDVWPSALIWQPVVWLFLREETQYRATLIVLALEAFRLEHGQLPETLDELVGDGLDAVPLDPLFAQPFLYFPKGFPKGVYAKGSDPRTGVSAGPSLPPILWSALSTTPNQQLRLAHPREPNENSPLPYLFLKGKAWIEADGGWRQGDRASISPTDVINAGTIFQIPWQEE
ncbi:MAG TPA: hypothetical protein VMF30_06535 [Pirellulales bacterium]|nr:hypothetical protein [Pirellulales bacterium]